MPDVVQNPDLKRERCVNSSECSITASWGPPLNNATANITHYVLYVNGINNYNITANSVTESYFFSKEDCDDLNNADITLSAINGCGEEGPIQQFPLRTVNSTRDCLAGGSPNVRKGELSPPLSLQCLLSKLQYSL